MLRLLAPDPFFYILGKLYASPRFVGGRGVYPGADKLFDLFEHEAHQGVQRLMAGRWCWSCRTTRCASSPVWRGMPVRRFIALNVMGTFARLVIFRQISFSFQDEIGKVLDFIARYQTWAIVITVVVVVDQPRRTGPPRSVSLDRGPRRATESTPGATGSETEHLVEADGDPGVVGDRLHRQQHPGHERRAVDRVVADRQRLARWCPA